MTQYTILYPAMIVHATGCSDIKRTATKRNVQADTMVNRDAANVAALIAAELEVDLTDMGYTASDFTVSPCAADKPAPKARKATTTKESTVTTTTIRECTTDGCTAPRIRANALKCTTHEVEYRAAAKARAAARKAAAEKAAMDNAIEYVRLAK